MVLVLLAACGPGDEKPTPEETCETRGDCPPVRRPARVESVTEVGFIGKPATVGGRDGAQSAALGGKLLWIFGDTFFATTSVDGTHYRTNTATVADVASPLVTTEPLDANGVPLTAIDWTDDEKAYNAAGTDNDRVALWNAGLVPDAASGTLLAFFEKLYTKPSGWVAAGIATARFRPGETTGARHDGLLFDRADDEPLFKSAMLHDGMVYLYGSRPGDVGARVARAPLARAEERAAYTFWDGAEWNTDVKQSVVLEKTLRPGVTVAWNAFLGQFVGIASETFGHAIELSTAPRPEGPWSERKVIFETREGADDQPTYVGTQHPALERDGGRTIAVSYSLPTACFLCGEVVLVDVTFKE